MTVYYFGCYQQLGHYLWVPGMRSSQWQPWDRQPGFLPWTEIDGKLPPQDNDQREGSHALHHLNGWTAWALWDRTVDSRFNSNSVFFAEGIHDVDAMKAIAAEHFPEVWDRVKGIVQE